MSTGKVQDEYLKGTRWVQKSYKIITEKVKDDYKKIY